jgi:dUTP pyrophosphatase
MSSIPVQIKILPHGRGVPAYGSLDAAGMDLCACIPEKITINPGDKSVLIPSGVAIFIRDIGYAGFIAPRSGLGHKKGLIVGNSVGVIDSGYTGEVFVSLCVRPGHEPVEINPGDRIAQMVVVPVVRAEFLVVDEFSEQTARGSGGFGSTGVN